LKDIFALQDEIAGLIAKQLQLELGATHQAREVNPKAHELVLEARFYWRQRFQDDLDRAEELLNQALALDPDFAQAHAAMGDVLLSRGTWDLFEGISGASEVLSSARHSAEKALDLDDSMAQPCGTIAWIYFMEGNMDKAEEWFEKVFARSAYIPLATHWYVSYLRSRGYPLKAYREAKKSYAHDPRAFLSAGEMGVTAHDMGELEEALKFYAQVNALRHGGHVHYLALQSWSLLELGRKNEAIEAARSIGQSWPTKPRWAGDALAIGTLYRAGLEKEAEQYAGEVLEALPEESYIQGWVLIAVDRFSEAVPYLSSSPSPYWSAFYHSALFDPYREDPLFKEMIERMGISEYYQRARAEIEQRKARKGRG
jgi:serine/threonine-protein kinase